MKKIKNFFLFNVHMYGNKKKYEKNIEFLKEKIFIFL